MEDVHILKKKNDVTGVNKKEFLVLNVWDAVPHEQ